MNAFMLDAIGEVMSMAYHQLLLRCAGSDGVNLIDRMIERGLVSMYAEIHKVSTRLLTSVDSDDDDFEGCMFDAPPPPAPTFEDDQRSEYMTGMFRNVPHTSIPPLSKEYGYDGVVVVSLRDTRVTTTHQPPWLREARYFRKPVLQTLRVTHISTSFKEYGDLLCALRPLAVDPEIPHQCGVYTSRAPSPSTNNNAVVVTTTTITVPDGFMMYYRSFVKHLSRELFIPLQHVTVIGDQFMSNINTVETIDLSPLCNVHTIGSCFLRCGGLITTIDLSPFTKVRRIGDNFMDTCQRLVKIDFTPLSGVEVIGQCFLGHSDIIRSKMDLSPIQHALT